MGVDATLAAIVLAFSVLLATPGLDQWVAPAAGQLPDPVCTVLPGQSIQAAVDAAGPGAMITVCPGIYAQQVVLHKSWITLSGLPGATMDGTSLVGERHAFIVPDGAHDVAVTGFEVRNYANPGAARDRSTAVVAWGGHTARITFADNDVHDNAHAGILAGDGVHDAWRVTGNTFVGDGRAGVPL